ncbi:MAG: hypothetical protein M5R40_25240 [Anaerolineae bacterium]|nr:hypothetical protein [Anaerolineae bacterium]
MKWGAFLLSVLFVGACVAAGALTGVAIHTRVNADRPQPVLLLAAGRDGALRAVWVASPAGDGLHLIGLPPETWSPAEAARLADLYAAGDERRLRGAVAALLEEVDYLAGTITFSTEALAALLPLNGDSLVLGAVPQDAHGLARYLDRSADPLDALDRQARVLKSLTAALARLDARDVAAALAGHARSALPEHVQAAFWRALVAQEARVLPTPRERLRAMQSGDSQPAYTLHP